MGARSYDEALSLLSTLQSNRAITSLFTPPPATASSPKPDLNAQAIPEMLLWLERAGYTPSDLASLETIHVAGTKGKGSVSALTTSILTRYPIAGRVGTYTSPHVVSVRERIMLNGRPISQDLFAKYFFQLWDRFAASAKAGGREEEGCRPFYFRFLTILAWHIFISEGIKSAVVECGIGGEYDATNVIPPEAVTAAVVTQLGIDHVAMLGDTAEKIAWHKAGIFKRGVKGFTRRLDSRPEVMEVLRRRAKEKGALLTELPDKEVLEWEGVVDARLKGNFQKFNMALAVAAAREHLMKLGHKFEGPFAEGDYHLRSIPVEFSDGLRNASLRGRCEVIRDEENGIEWYLDGAHTDESLQAAGEWFSSAANDTPKAMSVLLFNQQERDSQHLLKVLLQTVTSSSDSGSGPFQLAIFCRNEEDEPAEGEVRDMSVQEANEKVLHGLDPSKTYPSATKNAVKPALETIAGHAERWKNEGFTTKVLVTGSFHLVGAVIKNIQPVES
jgi:folylpolyglutamate synthase